MPVADVPRLQLLPKAYEAAAHCCGRFGPFGPAKKRRQGGAAGPGPVVAAEADAAER